MKKSVLIFVMCTVIVLTFFACGKKDNGENETETTVPADSQTEAESLIYNYNGSGSRNEVNSPDEALAYLDAKYDASQKNGNTEVFTLGGKTVMEKTYENGVLVKKVIYSDYETTVDYAYKDGKLESFTANARGEAKEMLYYKCTFYPSGVVDSAIFYDTMNGNSDLYVYDIDENGKVVEGYDTPEAVSELFGKLVQKGADKILKGGTAE